MQIKPRFGLYGGTFDPPHNAHLKLAQLSAEKLALDAVYFIPAAHHPFKGISQISSVSIRIEMLEKALEKYALFRISRIECDRSDISYTIDTLRNFMEYEKTGDAQLYFILGTDNFDEFHMWKNPDEIFDLATIVALRRPGSEKSTVLKKYQEHIILLDLPLLNISSTQIRNKIRRGEDYSDLVPPGIPEIVQRYNLYR